MRGIATGQLASERAACRTDDLGTKLILFAEVIVIDLELDGHLFLRDLVVRRFPTHAVKENVVAKVFRFDETELAVVTDVADLAEPLPLGRKRLGAVRVGTGRTLHGRETGFRQRMVEMLVTGGSLI